MSDEKKIVFTFVLVESGTERRWVCQDPGLVMRDANVCVSRGLCEGNAVAEWKRGQEVMGRSVATDSGRYKRWGSVGGGTPSIMRTEHRVDDILILSKDERFHLGDVLTITVEEEGLARYYSDYHKVPVPDDRREVFDRLFN